MCQNGRSAYATIQTHVFLYIRISVCTEMRLAVFILCSTISYMRARSATKTTRVTISLPAAMVQATDRQRLIELRNRSEIVREALRAYLSRIPTDRATPAEERAFARGDREIARGEYVTLHQLHHAMDGHHHQSRSKAAR